jgi:hypothetical protein
VAGAGAGAWTGAGVAAGAGAVATRLLDELRRANLASSAVPVAWAASVEGGTRVARRCFASDDAPAGPGGRRWSGSYPQLWHQSQSGWTGTRHSGHLTSVSTSGRAPLRS